MDIDVGICNIALGRIGCSQFIQSPTEKSNESITCGVFFDSCRDRVLTAFPWNFASRYAALAEIGDPPGSWRHRYQYPADCLRVRCLAPTEDAAIFTDPAIMAIVRRMGEHQRYPFEVVENEAGNGKAIVTYRGQLSAWYTARIANLSLWTEDARSALAWLVASEIAGPLSAKMEYGKAADDAYKMALIEAGTNSMNEGGEYRQPESQFLTARL